MNLSRDVFGPALCALEFRRALRRVLAPTLVFLAVALRLRGLPTTADPRALEVELATGAAVARGLLREDLWTAALLILVPLAVLQAAAIPSRWRAGEADWIGSKPLARATAILASWGGLAAALFATLAAAALAIEWRAGAGLGAGGTPVFAGRAPLDAVVTIEPGATLRLALNAQRLASAPERPSGAPLHARLRLTVLPGGDPTGRGGLAARVTSDPGPDLGPDASAGGSATRRVEGRTWLEVELPSTNTDVELELASLDGASLALLPETGIELWQRTGSEASASLALAKRAALGLACACALAFGLATWIGPWTAAGTALALWLACLSAGHARPWLAQAQLPGALDALGEGRLPGPLPIGALLAALLVGLASLALARRGLRSWRHAP